MYQKPGHGGLKVPNFELKVKSLLITWVKRILREENAKWKHVIQEFFPGVKIHDLFQSRCSIGSIWKGIPVFYSHILNAWNGFRSIFQPQSPVSVRKEMLWFNENILVQKKPIFYQKWYKKGIKFINDIVDENGEFLTLE